MIMVKRFLVAVSALAIAVAGWGALTANAASTTPDSAAQAQTSQAGYLGVRVSDTNGSVMVWSVEPASPADEAGIHIGDIIVAVDGQEISSADELVSTIQGYQPGEEISLTLEWRGETRDVSVTLAERPAETQQTQPSIPQQGGHMYEGMLDMFGLTASWTDQGLTVSSIEAGSPFADAGFEVGDVIVAINGEQIDNSTSGGWLRLFDFTDQPITFTIERDGEQMDLDVTLTMPMVGSGQGGSQGNGTTPSQPNQGSTIVTAQPTQLGVSFRTLTSAIAEEDNLPVQEGAQIIQVYPDTPAEKAGLQVDDIVVAVDGDKVDEEHTLADRLYAYEEGDQVTLSVQRGDEQLDIKVTLGPRANSTFEFPMMPGLNFGDTMPGQQGTQRYHYYFAPNTPDDGSSSSSGDSTRSQLPSMLDQFLQTHPFLRDYMGQQGSDGQTIPFQMVPDQSAPEQQTAPNVDSGAA